MNILRPLLLTVLFTMSMQAFAEDNINLLPKYGLLPKNAMQKAADAEFLASVDEAYKGNRKQAAELAAIRGWEFFRKGDMSQAMKRFNQAWLLDANNGQAIWGMAAIQGQAGKMTESFKLFAEAEALLGDDLDFAVDYVKTVSYVAARTQNSALLAKCYDRYAQLYQKAPEHTLNLQNWAITLYHAGDYAGAWDKLKLAEATKRRAEIDPTFVAALEKKMPRP